VLDGVQDGVEGGGRVVGVVVDVVVDQGEDAGLQTVQVGRDEGVLGRVEPVEGHLGQPEVGDELVHAHGADSPGVEQFPRAVEDQCFALRSGQCRSPRPGWVLRVGGAAVVGLPRRCHGPRLPP
jgi:hypothetical protein